MASIVHNVALVHWNADEARARVAKLNAAGFEAFAVTPSGPEAVREIRDALPAAVVISLERMPSHGRQFGSALRAYKGTREIPLVFVEGEPAKVDLVRQVLPDAVFTSWRGIRGALRSALTNPPGPPLAPRSSIANPATPLVRKLGIRAGSVTGLLNPPPGLASTLGDLPDQAELADYTDSRWTMLLWFARTRDDVESEIEWVAAARDKPNFWIFWPKRSSGVPSDLSPTVIRATAQRHGLTDYKICSFDDTWSGIALAQRRKR